MYALADGLPLVADPQHHIDQPIVAHQVAAQGAGIALAKDADASEIQQAVTTMLESDEPADAANAIGERIRARSGTLVAVERAEALLNDQVPA